MNGRSFLLLITLVVPLVSTPVRADLKECRELLQQNTLRRLSQRLSAYPELRSFLAPLIQRNDAPTFLLRLIDEALSEPLLEVRRLNHKARRQFDLSSKVNGAISIERKTYSDNGQEFVSITHPAEKPVLLLLADAQPEQSLKNTTTLIHELAHLHFNQFLRHREQKLAKSFPESLIQPSPEKQGEWFMDHDLYRFLHERYAYEVGARFSYIWAYSRLDLKTRFPLLWKQELKRINAHIISNYKIENPEVLAIQDYSLGDILLGRPWKKAPTPSPSWLSRLWSWLD